MCVCDEEPNSDGTITDQNNTPAIVGTRLGNEVGLIITGMSSLLMMF